LTANIQLLGNRQRRSEKFKSIGGKHD
jgi:hypothetical protein